MESVGLEISTGLSPTSGLQASEAHEEHASAVKSKFQILQKSGQSPVAVCRVASTRSLQQGT